MVGRARAMMAGAAALGAVLAAVPAVADVKAGVDAWTRGDYAAAVREWTGPATEGDPDAQFNMAQAYRLGRGVDIDLEQAEALYASAAAQGHIKAADNYGLLLFQRGAREQAMPYVAAAASRGDPRAQYLLGIAHFNGDLAEKDWRRAYALLTLANAAGLPQARAAIGQMDEHIPLEDRQAAQVLAASLRSEAEARRARELAAVDLAVASNSPSVPAVAAAPPAAVAPRVSGTARPSGVGADFTLAPSPAASPPPAAAPQATVPAAAAKLAQTEKTPAAAPAVSSAPKPVAAPSGGKWKVQLGAFGVPANVDRLWNKLARRAEIAGHEKLLEPEGGLTKLLAGGYATQGEARAACASLKRSGQECMVTR